MDRDSLLGPHLLLSGDPPLFSGAGEDGIGAGGRLSLHNPADDISCRMALSGRAYRLEPRRRLRPCPVGGLSYGTGIKKGTGYVPFFMS